MANLGTSKKLSISFEEALLAVPAALATEGFGVLTQVDVKKTFADKLGVDFRNYRILGACNPKLAHGALSSELSAGLMMPCNVVVYEDDDGKATVMAVDPSATVSSLSAPALTALATEVGAKLERVLERLA